MEKRFMLQMVSRHVSSIELARNACLLSSLILALSATGCGSGNGTAGTSPVSPTHGPQTYFAPYVAATTNGGVIFKGPMVYAIDDFANTFSESNFALQPPQQQGPQIINTGCFLSQTQCTPNVVDVAAGQRGLLSLGITTNYISNATGSPPSYVAKTYNPPKTGSFAVELAGQAGGLVQIVGQPVEPLVAAVQCPNLKTAQSYQFLTIPAGLIDSASAGQQPGFWDPTTDTAYGSADISSDGNKISFSNIHQYTLPSVAGSGSPAQLPTSPIVGTCAPTIFGNTIIVGQLSVTTPGGTGGQSVPPQATVAIGPTGLLVEHNGAGDTNGTLPGTSPALYYDNSLGAGTGAVGLPKPSSALDISAFRSGQYLGFIYGAGVYSGNVSAPASSWSSHLASFGFSTMPSSCASVAASTATMIYGGDFTNDDPTTSHDGFGNCDLAVDLGVQDAANNGLFTKATVWLGANYAANTTGQTYSFPAVAIAGQLNSKNAIFVLGVDSAQPWAIYLLQSN